MLKTLSDAEALALTAGATSSEYGIAAARSGISKQANNLMAAAHANKVRLDTVLEGLSTGTDDHGDKILLQVLAILVRYITSWGVLIIMTLGVLAVVQKAREASGWLKGKFAAIGSIFAPFSGLVGSVASFFHKDEANEDPAQSLETMVRLAGMSVPLFGVMLQTLTDAPKGDILKGRTMSGVLAGGGYDAQEDPSGDIAYDAEGNEYDLSRFN